MIFDDIYVFVSGQHPLVIFVGLVALVIAVLFLMEFFEGSGGNRRN